MKLWQINKAVSALCDDVERVVKISSYEEMNEEMLIHELVICILGSGVRYEMAVSFANAIRKNGILSNDEYLDFDTTYQYLKKILQSIVEDDDIGRIYKSYRYPDRGAKYIAHSFLNIYTEYKSLKSLMELGKNPYLLRRELIRICPGIGPKQASHFLKNSGYTDNVAIIDRHILKYMELVENRKISASKVRKIEFYECLEKRFIDAAKKFKYSVSVVDQSMWFVMRAISKVSLA